MTDQEFLKRYADSGSEEAFAQVMNRHRDWVYSACLRRLGDPHVAEDVAQAVFVALARKAGTLQRHTSLTGWLHQAVRFAALDAQKSARRRTEHEARAAMSRRFSSAESEEATWERLATVLEPALDALPARHRVAILLRFYEKKTHPEIAAALAISEEAAKKRVTRALNVLRSSLARKGTLFSVAGLGVLLSARAVDAAPVTLSAAAALAKVSASTGAAWTLSEGVLRMVFWSKTKAILGYGVILAGVAIGGLLGARALAQRQNAAAPASAAIAAAPVSGAAAGGAASEPGETPIDALIRFNHATVALNAEEMAGLMLADTQEEKDFLRVRLGLVRSLFGLKEALVARQFAPADIDDLFLPQVPTIPASAIAQATVVMDGEKATVVLPDLPTFPPLTMTRVEGHWRIPLKPISGMSIARTAEELATMLAQDKLTNEALDRLTAAVKSDKPLTLGEVQEAFAAAFKPVGGGSAGVPAQGGK